jgi:hypothetical protein
MEYQWKTILLETIFGENEEGDQVFIEYLKENGIAYERTEASGSAGWPILKFTGLPAKLEELLYQKFGLQEWEIGEQYPNLNEDKSEE